MCQLRGGRAASKPLDPTVTPALSVAGKSELLKLSSDFTRAIGHSHMLHYINACNLEIKRQLSNVIFRAKGGSDPRLEEEAGKDSTSRKRAWAVF